MEVHHPVSLTILDRSP